MYEVFKTIVEMRNSANFYDPSRSLPDNAIKELVRLATLAPSAYHFQNWKFIAVRSSEAKARLKSVAFGQNKVMDAPVTFIVCGLLNAHHHLEQALQPAVEAGLMDIASASTLVRQATDSHAANPELQRDEAMRSASLAAMVLLLAAKSMGFDACPMGGFDPQALAQEFNLAVDELPVMLITVGYGAAGNWPQKPRRPVSDILVYA